MVKAKALAKEAVGFLPGVGTAMDVADVAKSVATGDYVGAAVNTAATVLGIVPGVGRVAGKGLKAVTKSLRQADVEDAKRLIDDPVEKKLWQKDFGVDQKQKRIPEVQEAAEKLSEGKITSGEYRRTVKAKQPIDSIAEDNFPEFPTLKSIVGSLDKNKVEKGIVGVNKVIPDGTRVGSRLDIPAYEDYDTWVVSLHDGTVAGGKAIGYAQTAILKNVEFLSSAKGGLNIAKGKSKSTIARIHGDYYNADPEDTYALSKELLNDPEWTQVGMNPFRHSYFYNKATGQPVLEAKEVIQVGPLVLAKGIKVPTISDLKRLKVKTPDKKIRMFNKGGDTMEQQMNFAFMNEGGVLADDGVERDPVSGNEVPAGSMAEEVRDDVPAMLSEGEYVVPADVVRFHGIQKFEELRDEAKMGLQRMEADGRIGGQPVEEQEEFPFPVEELEGFNEGGAVGDTYSDVMGSDFRANQRYGSLPTMGFELRNFTNPKTGQTVVIPFFNGQPMQYIPPDFLESDASTTGGGGSSQVGDDGGRQETTPRGTGMSDLAYEAASKALRGAKTAPQTKPFSEYSTEDFRKYVQTRQGVLGRVMDAIPVVGIITSMQDNAAREFARRSLIQGKNIATGQPLTNNDASVLMQVADLPKGRSVLSAIDDFLQGKTSLPGGTYKGTKPIVVDDRPPIDTELRRTTYEAETPVATQQDVSSLYGDRGFTPETIGEDPAQAQTEQMFPTELGEQDTGFADATVAEEAKGIIDYAWVVVPGVNLNKKFRIDKKNLHLVGASSNDSARAILATDKHGMFDPTLRKTTGKGNLIQVHSEGPKNAKVLGKEELARYSGANVNASASDVQAIIESNNDKINKDKKGFIQTIKNAFDMSAGAATPTQGTVLTGTGVTAPVSLITNALSDIGLDRNTANYGAILSKVGYESRANGKDFTKLSEDLTYRTGGKNYKNVEDRLRAIFPTKLGKLSNKQIQDLNIINNPKNFGNYIYDGVNGNTEVGDGYKYRGRSYVMLTGRENYRNVGNKLGVNLENMSEQQLNKWFSNKQNSANATAAFFAIENDRGKDLTSMASINKVVGGANQNVKLKPEYVLTKPSETGAAIAQPRDVSRFYGQRFDPSKVGTDPTLGVSQPLQPFVPPQAPTADQIRLAGGIDAFAKSQLPTGTEQRTTGLQDLPVGVSIEADGKFTGTGGLGAVQAPRVGTPIVKRDFLDPNMSMSRREVLSDPTRFTGPAGAGIGPVSEDETLQTGLATDFNRFTERADRTPITVPRTADDKPVISQTDAMLADLQPKVASTFDTESATRPRRLGMSPGAMGGRQLGMSPGAMGGRAAPSAPTSDFVFDYGFGTEGSPKEEQVSDTEYKSNIKKATDKVYDEARERGDQARDEVLRQGGSVEEAYDAMHTAFTGFDRAGNMVSTDPGTAAMDRFSKGGLASKSKKTKPKKRNIKNGLGGKMAT